MSLVRCHVSKACISKIVNSSPKNFLNSYNLKRNFSTQPKQKNIYFNASLQQKKETFSFFLTSNKPLKFSNNATLSLFSTRTFATATPKPASTTTVEGIANEAAKTPVVNSETVQDLANAVVEPSQHIVQNLPVWETLKNSYLSWINPGNWAEAIIESIHFYTGLPWWVSIIVAVLGVRVLLFPVAVRSARYGLIMKEIQPTLTDLMARTRLAQQENNYVLMRQLSAEMSSIYNQYGVSLFTGMKFALIQAPIFLSFFWALRQMAEHVPGFTTGGWGFFTDLSAFDPYMRLPILSAVLFAVAAEWGTESIRSTPNPIVSRVIMYAFAAISIVVSRYFPMALHVYWISSSIFSLISMMLIKRTPLFKRWLYDWQKIEKATPQKVFLKNPLKNKGVGVQEPGMLNKQLKTPKVKQPQSKDNTKK